MANKNMGIFRESKQPSAEKEPTGREITDKEAVEFARDKNFDEAFISVTDRKKRDAEKKLLMPGEAIINNPENPGLLMEDNPINRRGFIQHGFSFKFEEPYATIEQKEKILVDGDVKDYFAEMVQKAKDFKEKVDSIKPVALAKDTRDMQKKLLLKGREAIVDPTYEELVMEDTPENRAAFVENGGTWKPEK